MSKPDIWRQEAINWAAIRTDLTAISVGLAKLRTGNLAKSASLAEAEAVAARTLAAVDRITAQPALSAFDLLRQAAPAGSA